MGHRAFRLAYDGTGYRGFQRQPDVPTVEGALFEALDELDVPGPPTEPPPAYAAAGRTDAGVSAVAQTVAFDAPDWLVPRALDARLPDTVRAWAGASVPPSFHATHDAAAREYGYHLHAPTADADLARQAATALAGRHDYHNLTPDDTGTVRRLSIEVDRDGDYLPVRVRGPGFPRQLVRRLVAVIAAVASGEREPAFVDRVLGTEPLSGSDGIAPARPEPLVLADVRYPDVSFTVDDAALAEARSAFAGRRITQLTAARVAASVLDGLPNWQ